MPRNEQFHVIRISKGIYQALKVLRDKEGMGLVPMNIYLENKLRHLAQGMVGVYAGQEEITLYRIDKRLEEIENALGLSLDKPAKPLLRIDDNAPRKTSVQGIGQLGDKAPERHPRHKKP
jgi:hypothetical protein